MMEYEALVARVKTALAEDEDIKITAADIEHLSAEQIDNIQNIFNEFSLSYIENARRNKLIDDEAAEYLSGIYGDAMETYRVLYRNITASLIQEYRPDKIRRLQELDEELAPEQINAIDLETGKVEENVENDGPHDNMSKYKEYQTRHITPFTSMRLTFYDFRDNPIYVILPGLKNVRRAIDKIKMPVYDEKGKLVSAGGKYYMQYSKDVAKIRLRYAKELSLRYGNNTEAYKKAMQEMEPQIQAEIASVPKPFQRLKDVVRMTITRKYYTDTDETLNMFVNTPEYGVSEIRDSFYDNTSDSSKYGMKNYREKRAYLNMETKGKRFQVETQIKITKLYEGDIHTHLIYAGKENAESRDDNQLLISSQNTGQKGLRFWEENIGRFQGTADRLIAKMNIFKHQLAIQKINKNAIRAYNLQVLDKAFRLEDAKLANGKKFDAEVYSPQNARNEQIFGSVADFISKNFIYRPFKAYDMEQAFNVTDDELKSLGLVINAEQIQSFANRYSSFIMEKYNGRITGNETLYLGDSYYESEYSPKGLVDESFPDAYELETLSRLEGEDNDEWQEYIYKRLDNKRRNYHNKRQQARKHNMKRAFSQKHMSR